MRLVDLDGIYEIISDLTSRISANICEVFSSLELMSPDLCSGFWTEEHDVPCEEHQQPLLYIKEFG